MPLNTIKTYYSNGKVKTETNYKDGLKDGIKTEYFINGKTRKQYSYTQNILQGKCFEYNEDGTLKIRGHFYDGKAVGPFFYYSNGKLTLYNERDFYGVYYVKKYDQNGNVIKEEGFAVSPYSDTTAILTTTNHSIGTYFFYAEPTGYNNILKAWINDSSIKVEKTEDHVIKMFGSFPKIGTYTYRIISTLTRDGTKLFTDTTQRKIIVK